MIPNAQTKIFGIIGNPLGHTFSPTMHNSGYKALGLNAVYLAFPIKNLIQLKFSMKQWSIQGLSVTIPHKIAIRRHLDRIDPLALQIGSINTIHWGKTGLLEGSNTDGPGAIMALKKNKVVLEGKRILILGSGGSARGIAFALAQEKPAEIAIWARNPMMAMQLGRNLTLNKGNPSVTLIQAKTEKKTRLSDSIADLLPQSGRRWQTVRDWDFDLLREYDLVIHTTPMGMKGGSDPNASPLPSDAFSNKQCVFDIVYNPALTPLVKLARKKGAEIVEGYEMLLYQGVMQFELFTGAAAPVKVMRKALVDALKKI